MEEFVGLDVSQKLTHVCMIDASGKRLWQGSCDSTPEAIAETIKARSPKATRILTRRDAGCPPDALGGPGAGVERRGGEVFVATQC